MNVLRVHDGAALPVPLGIVDDMSSEDYHALDALGSSGLRKLGKSPLHYFGTTLDPQRPFAAASDAQLSGTLAHCALLEPDALVTRYAVKPPGHDGRTREGRAWNVAHAGRTIIHADQLATAQYQAHQIRALPEIGPLLEQGAPEVSAFWVDQRTGVHCKCRPDWVSPVDMDPAGVVLLDLKTTQDASEAGFARSIWNYGYHLQAAWYVDGFELASGLMVLGFVFVCVEAEWPHAASAFMLDDRAMDLARARNRELVDLYAACRAAGEWPGYASTIRPISLPAWAR